MFGSLYVLFLVSEIKGLVYLFLFLFCGIVFFIMVIWWGVKVCIVEFLMKIIEK